MFDAADFRDLSRAAPGIIDAAGQALALPHLGAFLLGIATIQVADPQTGVRRYLDALLRQGWFEIVCPWTGEPLRSGSTLVVADIRKFVVAVRDRPDLLLCVGDLGAGLPICGALLPSTRSFLRITAGDWGFTPDHLAPLRRTMATSGWRPGPAAGDPVLVLGHPNFAHHIWNDLALLDHLSRQPPARPLRVLTTHQPLGPVRELFPDLAGWTFEAVDAAGVGQANAAGALPVHGAGCRISLSLRERVSRWCGGRLTPAGRQLDAALGEVRGPILWLGLRSERRSATNQRDLLGAVARAFLAAAPGGAVILDGFSPAADLPRYPGWLQDLARHAIAQDRDAAAELAADLPAGATHIAVGLPIADSLVLGRHATIYLCPHGTTQHKIGWFHDVPGMVHSNTLVAGNNPAAWVASQSAIARRPSYLPPHFFEDAPIPATVDPVHVALLRPGNYRCIDVPGVTREFMRFAERVSGLARPPPS